MNRLRTFRVDLKFRFNGIEKTLIGEIVRAKNAQAARNKLLNRVPVGASAIMWNTELLVGDERMTEEEREAQFVGSSSFIKHLDLIDSLRTTYVFYEQKFLGKKDEDALKLKAFLEEKIRRKVAGNCPHLRRARFHLFAALECLESAGFRIVGPEKTEPQGTKPCPKAE